MKPDVLPDQAHLEIEREPPALEIASGGGNRLRLQREHHLVAMKVRRRVLQPEGVDGKHREGQQDETHLGATLRHG